MSTRVLYLGATGYIGGSALVSLIKKYPDVEFTALVRSQGDLAAVASTGAIAIHDTLKDCDSLSDRVAQADIVFNSADTDDVALTVTILNGLKKRYDSGKGIATLIHTSGAADFLDGNKEGKYDPNAKVWTDSEDDIKQITTDFLHGKVEVPILKAGEEGFANTFIISPSTVFGKGDGPVKKVGPYLLGQFIKRGGAFYIGEGTNKFSLVHIKDLVEVYELVFKRALETRSKPLIDSPYSRYYLVTSNALPWKDVANAYAKALYERGKVKKPEADRLTFEEGGPLAFVWSSSMYVKTVQTRTLGWEPKYIVDQDVLVEGIDDGLS